MYEVLGNLGTNEEKDSSSKLEERKTKREESQMEKWVAELSCT